MLCPQTLGIRLRRPTPPYQHCSWSLLFLLDIYHSYPFYCLLLKLYYVFTVPMLGLQVLGIRLRRPTPPFQHRSWSLLLFLDIDRSYHLSNSGEGSPVLEIVSLYFSVPNLCLQTLGLRLQRPTPPYRICSWSLLLLLNTYHSYFFQLPGWCPVIEMVSLYCIVPMLCLQTLGIRLRRPTPPDRVARGVCYFY